MMTGERGRGFWSGYHHWSLGTDTFLHTGPGVGKTYLIPLIDSLCDQADGKDIAVARLNCDFLAQQEQTIVNMLGAFLKQLVGRGERADIMRIIPETISEIFLLVSLNIDAILREMEIRLRRRESNRVTQSIQTRNGGPDVGIAFGTTVAGR